MLLVSGVTAACANPRAPSSTQPAALPTKSSTVAVERAPAKAKPEPSKLAPPAPVKIELREVAMGTSVTFVAFTNERADEAAVRAAMASALTRMRGLEAVLSEWRDDSEIGQLNLHAGEWVPMGPESLEVIQKGLWAGRLSGGVFDITFQAMKDVWKFGTASEAEPHVPTHKEIEARRRLVDYRKVEIDEGAHAVRIGKQQQVGLGGIAKGYIVDKAARVLRDAGVDAFLVQAGGDLYGAGRKPDGSPWVSGIQDPRGAPGQFFATIELTDHAFSTAGDYARAYVVKGKRYHHIIDPRTGYPATACRSVTVWAPDAFIADAVDDIVFILGPEKGIPLVESLDGVGAVIVDEKNHVTVTRRLEGKVHVVSAPTDGI